MQPNGTGTIQGNNEDDKNGNDFFGDQNRTSVDKMKMTPAMRLGFEIRVWVWEVRVWVGEVRVWVWVWDRVTDSSGFMSFCPFYL